jgi:hypothetical protein
LGDKDNVGGLGAVLLQQQSTSTGRESTESSDQEGCG